MTTTAVVAVDELPTAPAEDVEVAAGRATAEQILRGAIVTLDELLAAHPADVEGNTRAWLLIGRMLSDLGDVRDHAVANLTAHMPGKRVVIPGVGVLERKTATSSSAWDQDGLWSWIARTTAGRYQVIDPETGEDATGEVVGAVVAEARAMQTPGAWRKTALRDRGIDPEEVSTVTWGKATVRFYGTTNG